MNIISSIKNYFNKMFKKNSQEIIPGGCPGALIIYLSKKDFHSAESVKCMLDANTDPNVTDLNKNPAIILAAKNTEGYATDFVYTLLNSEIPLDVDKTDNTKSTALMKAIQNHNLPAAELLLAAGANIHIENSSKLSAKKLCATAAWLPEEFKTKLVKFEKLKLTSQSLNKQAYVTGKLLSTIFTPELLNIIGEYAHYKHRRKYFNNKESYKKPRNFKIPFNAP